MHHIQLLFHTYFRSNGFSSFNSSWIGGATSVKGGGDENKGQPAKGGGKKFGQALKGGERISDMNLFSWITEIQCYLEFSWFSWVFYFQVRGGSEKFWMRRKGGGRQKVEDMSFGSSIFWNHKVN